MHRGHRTPHSRVRGRSRSADGSWQIKPPLTPLIEPALLLALRAGTSHGYELAEQIGDYLGLSRIDHGNLYRGLRRLEEEDIVASEWDDTAVGRAKRTYTLTTNGEALLDKWAETLHFTRERLTALLDSYEGTT